MNILCDLHHLGLYKSFELLFEKRLGHKLYRPIGVEWFDEGYWDIAKPYGNARDTVMQYLEIKQQDIPEEIRLNEGARLNNGVYYCDNSKAVTFETAKEMGIDLIIASIPDHYKSYTRMRDKHFPKAKVICHAGNDFGKYDWSLVRNFLASVKEIPTPTDTNAVFYHQEIDPIYQPCKTTPDNIITSLLHTPYKYPDYPLWQRLQAEMTDFTFKEYGMGGTLPPLHQEKDVFRALCDSKFVFHLKFGGDGFGHVIHDCFAVGRPPIVKYEYYKDCLAGELMIDGKTCVFWQDSKPFAWNIDNIRHNTEQYQRLSENAIAQFNKIVDYNEEQKNIVKFLEKLI